MDKLPFRCTISCSARVYTQFGRYRKPPPSPRISDTSLLAMFGSNNNSANNIRMTGGALVGISYFVILPFVQYYGQINQWPSEYLTAAAYVAVILPVLLGVALIKFDISRGGAVLLLSLFAGLAVVRFGFENVIEQEIASISSFYGDANPFSDSTAAAASSDKKILLKNSGYSISVPRVWGIEKIEDQLELLFRFEGSKGGVVQMLGSCFDTSKNSINIPEIVTSLRNEHRGDGGSSPVTACYNKSGLNVCFVQYRLSENNRWIMYAREGSRSIGVSLEFSSEVDDPYSENMAAQIIASIKNEVDGDAHASCPNISSVRSLAY